MEKKLTDEEAVKALECCSTKTYCEDKCEYRLSSHGFECIPKMMKQALDLIYRLQTELEEKDKERLRWGKLVIERNREIKALKQEKEELGKQLHERALKYCTLQAEKERLTEENEYLDGCAKQFLADYQKCEIERAEIQKQVDELKQNQVIECHGMLKGCDMVKQAVEDTAKDLLIEFNEWINGHYDQKYDAYCVHIPVDEVSEFLMQKLKEYGVEVE